MITRNIEFCCELMAFSPRKSFNVDYVIESGYFITSNYLYFYLLIDGVDQIIRSS